MKTRYNYNQQVSPPAPFVHVTIARVDDTRLSAGDLPAQLDIAADITAIPMNLVNVLQLVQLDQLPVAGFGGHVALLPTYLVRLTVRQFAPLLLRVVAASDEPFVLLGRDVLNRYAVMLDGPNLVVEILSENP